MNNALFVEVLDSFKDRPNNSCHFFVCETNSMILTLSHQLFESASWDKLHEKVETVVGFLERVELDDIRVANRF